MDCEAKRATKSTPKNSRNINSHKSLSTVIPAAQHMNTTDNDTPTRGTPAAAPTTPDEDTDVIQQAVDHIEGATSTRVGPNKTTMTTTPLP